MAVNKSNKIKSRQASSQEAVDSEGTLQVQPRWCGREGSGGSVPLRSAIADKDIVRPWKLWRLVEFLSKVARHPPVVRRRKGLVQDGNKTIDISLLESHGVQEQAKRTDLGQRKVVVSAIRRSRKAMQRCTNVGRECSKKE